MVLLLARFIPSAYPVLRPASRIGYDEGMARLPRYSLRTLFVVVTVCCLYLGWRWRIVLGPIEFVILIVTAIVLWRGLRRINKMLGGPGPFLFGFGTVPVNDAPPPCDPDSKREKP